MSIELHLPLSCSIHPNDIPHHRRKMIKCNASHRAPLSAFRSAVVKFIDENMGSIGRSGRSINTLAISYWCDGRISYTTRRNADLILEKGVYEDFELDYTHEETTAVRLEQDTTSEDKSSNDENEYSGFTGWTMQPRHGQYVVPTITQSGIDFDKTYVSTSADVATFVPFLFKYWNGHMYSLCSYSHLRPSDRRLIQLFVCEEVVVLVESAASESAAQLERGVYRIPTETAEDHIYYRCVRHEHNCGILESWWKRWHHTTDDLQSTG